MASAKLDKRNREKGRLAAGPLTVKRLRLAKTLRDPDLLAQAKKKNLEVDPRSGQDLEALTKEVLSANEELIERTGKPSRQVKLRWKSIEPRILARSEVVQEV